MKILYEDNDLLVCCKPAGLPVQTASVSARDMVSELKNYLVQAENTSKGRNGSKEPYLGVVHRLDQPVSGVLVFAKNPTAAADLSNQVQDGRMNKQYKALVWGVPNPKEAFLEHFLQKDMKTNKSYVAASGKKSKLFYKVEKELEEDGEICSQVAIKLYTGRHHQIRVQMAAVGHPILGDTKYGTMKKSSSLKLCAYELTFVHPGTKKEMTFTVPNLPWA